MVAPPLSLRGVFNSLRAPRLADLVFSVKAYLAAALALLAGFSQNLENPFWAVLTIYIVLAPPQTGALRSRAIFRIIGTAGGGAVILALTGLFGDELGILATATIAVVALATFLRQIDRTPSSDLWFAGAVTAGVIGLTNLMQPGDMFYPATARVGEISVGILAIAAVDSLVLPRSMTPDFLLTLAGWRRDALRLVLNGIDIAGSPPFDEPRLLAARQGLRGLTKAVGAIDGKAIQLPFDIVDIAPRTRHLNFVRHQVVELIANLLALQFRAHALREDRLLDEHIGDRIAKFRAWISSKTNAQGVSVMERAVNGKALNAELTAACAGLDRAADRFTTAERGLLLSMTAFVRNWSALTQVLHAIEMGTSLPPALDKIARRAKPVRSIDYLGAALDLAPLVLAMSVTLTLWYMTAWGSGAGALLFSFIGSVFLVGQGAILQSAIGLASAMLLAFALVFAYQFSILPRVTDFPALIAVLGCAMLPLGILMTMSPMGMLICVYLFAFLGLQSNYAGDFETSLQTLSASLVGLVIGVTCLYVCGYSRGRFVSRRLISAVRRDILDLANGRQVPERRRFLFLLVDRLALFFPAAEQVAGGKPLPRIGMLDDFAVGFNLLALREQEGRVSQPVRDTILMLRRAAADTYRDKLAGKAVDGAFRAQVDAAIDDPAIWADAARDDLLNALSGLQLALIATASSSGALSR